MLSRRARAAIDAPLPVLIMHDVLLAVRPARPLLRAGARAGGVPPAVRAEGHPARHEAGAADGRHQPAALQRRARGRPAQRGDDRARRLHRRVRPAAAQCSCCRCTSGSRSSWRRRGSSSEPELAALLDSFESADGKDVLLDIAESTRLQAILFQHNDYYGRRAPGSSRAADRYLDLLAAALLDELYLDHELRLAYLAELHRAREGARTGPSSATRSARCSSSGSGSSRNAAPARCRATRSRRFDAPLHRHGPRRGSTICGGASTLVRDERVAGDLVECGTRSGRRRDLHARLPRRPTRSNARSVWVADRFRVEHQLAEATAASSRGPTSTRCATASPASACSTTASGSCRVRPSDTLSDAPIEQVALVHIGATAEPADIGATSATRSTTASRIGGVVVVDDYATRERAPTRSRGSAPANEIGAPIERVGRVGRLVAQDRCRRGRR